MSIDAAIAIVWDVLKMGFAPIKRRFGYVMSSKSYADNLQQEVNNLDDWVRSADDEARNKNRSIHAWVPEFLKSAEDASLEAKGLLGEFNRASKTCCGGTLPDPNCRYQFSRKAKRKTDYIQKLIREKKDQEISFISPMVFAADLGNEVGNLENQVERVAVLEEAAENNVRDFHGVFKTWKDNAEKALKEARDLLGDFERASKTCCHGTLPDPCCCVPFNKKAEVEIGVIKNLAQEGSGFRTVDDICFVGPAPTPARREGKGVVQSITTATASVLSASMSVKLRDRGVFESRALMIRNIMDALADGNKSVVGVYGMGGVGKSTLLEDVKRMLIETEERLFDWVAKADVSKNASIETIQAEIAEGLKLTDLESKKIISVRAELLHKRLEKEEKEKKKVLIILDNLWEQLDLKSVGIPCGDDNKAVGCKLLLTSRDRRVLQREMRCESDATFLLGELEEEEAKRLLEKMVGGKVPVELEPLVEEALRICAGLPFLIVAISKLFIDTTYSDCEYALKQIWSEDTGKVITRTLQLSYDRITDEEAKSLLRLCAVCGVSEPPLEDLARYSFGLGIFRGVGSVQETRVRLSSLIHTLQSSSLLLHGEEYADGFKIHDLVREFLVSYTSTNHHFLLLKDKYTLEIALSENKLKSCEAICFPYVDLKELSEKLNCPELQIILLFSKNKYHQISDSYFKSMTNLMALDLFGIRVSRLPSPFQSLKYLHTLCANCCSLEDVAILGELKSLQILSLRNSDIQRLPKEIGQLTELRLLDLDDCSELQVIEPGVLGSLTKLEELYMKDSFDNWNAAELTPATNASLIELNKMKKLCTLHVSIPDPNVLPKDLDVEKLTKYRIQIGNVRRWSEYKGSTAVELKLDLTSDVLRKDCIQIILRKTDVLLLDGLNGNEQSINALPLEGLPRLKHLKVADSPSVRYILEWSSLAVFEALETLLLENLVNLEKICPNRFSTKSFRALKIVRVMQCEKMEVLFPRSVVRELPLLEEIKVVNCDLMQGIVEADDDRGKLELPKLRVLELDNLPNIKNFFTASSTPSSSSSNDKGGTQIAFFNGQQVSIPSLESLIMKGLPNLKEIWSDESPLGLSNLQSLKVMGCGSLSKIISSRLLVKLHKLHTLTIKDCASVQEIFELDGPSANGVVETMSELTTLELGSLPSLRCIWSKDPSGITGFHNLKKLNVEFCHNLEFVFFPSMVKSLTQLRDLDVGLCDKMETIIPEEGGLGMEISETLPFPMLTVLRLRRLKSLTSFSRAKCSREVQSQDHVQPCSTVLFNQEVAFSRLDTLDVDSLDNFGFVFFPSTVKSLAQLKELTVWDCRNMEAIIVEEEGLGMDPSENLAFPMLTFLQLGYLRRLKCFSRGMCSRETQSHDCVESCSTAFFNREVAFPNLETLRIVGMDNIEMIWSNQLTEDSFHNLKSISVFGCERITSLFPVSIARALTQLEKLEIYNSGIVELIEKEEESAPKFVFPNLTSLKLKHLTELKCLYTGTHTSHWPALKTLEVDGCDKVEIFASQTDNGMQHRKQPLFLIEKGAFRNVQELKLDLSERMEIWHGHFHDEELFCQLRVLEFRHLSRESQISTCRFVDGLTNLEELVLCESYLGEPSSNEEAIEGTSHEPKVKLLSSGYIRRLHTLDVSHYDGLSKMFTPSVAENLVALKKLKISNCRILTEVINDEEGAEGRVVAFNQLKYIELNGLIELRCFSLGGYTLMFPLLEDVIVNACPNMKYFSEGPIETPKLERVRGEMKELYLRTKYQYFWKGNLNITIQNMFEEMATIVGAKFMRLFDFPELVEKWHNELNPIKCSWQLAELVVDNCPSFINAIPSNLMLVLEKMTSLQVRNCESLEEIFNLEGLEVVGSTQVLPRLSRLDLINLPKLRQLWNKDLQGMMRFNSLRSLTLYECSNLRHALAPSMALCLATLTHLKIKECSQMEGVIEEEEEGSVVKKITFPNLQGIVLECLPNLTSFLLRENHRLECPQLKVLTITHCPKMRSLTWQSWLEIDNHTPPLFTPQVQFPQLQQMSLSHVDNLSKIWADDPQENLTFDYLRQVNFQNCKSLENLFPYWMATSLTLLKELRVESCGIEEIVSSGDDTPHSNIAQVLFPALASLVLYDMPRLKTFCPNLPTLNWPLLEELRVSHCDKVNTLSFAAFMNKWTQRNDQQDLLEQEAHFSFERDFPKLKKPLLDAKDIRMIREGKYPDDIFGKPKELTLACFHGGSAVFPPIFVLERFRNLQSLEIFCSSFEDIFPDEGFVDEGKRSVLESLTKLKLSKLHKLKCVWREDYLVSKILQSIKELVIWDCPGLTILFPAAASFLNLTKLVVSNSSGLIHLGIASTVSNLVNLTRMTIMGCERMKEVVTDDENEERRVIYFKKLQRLKLENMASLECFSSTTSCILKFPSLGWIEVEECPKMNIFSKGTVSTPRLYLGRLFGHEWRVFREWEGDLNRAIKKLSVICTAQ